MFIAHDGKESLAPEERDVSFRDAKIALLRSLNLFGILVL
jgi:hypothetical protein